jgi:predicted HicB family RNase H-like nuclease
MARGHGFSAIIYIRTTPQLHGAAAQKAAQRGLSMSAYVASVLADAAGVAGWAVQTEARKHHPSSSSVIFVRTSPELRDHLAAFAGRSKLTIGEWAEAVLSLELAVRPRSVAAQSWAAAIQQDSWDSL